LGGRVSVRERESVCDSVRACVCVHEYKHEPTEEEKKQCRQ
jgi:hypothetical protein